VSRVVLTQPAPRVERLAGALRARGHEVAVLPSRRIEPLTAGRRPTELLATIEQFDWVVFVSPGAIEVALCALPGGWPASTGVAVIGPGSADALAEHGVRPGSVRIAMPDAPPYDADALMRVPPFDAPHGVRVLVLRGEQGRLDWIETLRSRGAIVRAESIYRTVPCEAAPAELARLQSWASSGLPTLWVFSSADAIAATAALLRERGLQAWAGLQRALTIHPKLLEASRSAGWQATQLIGPGERALVAAIESA